MSTLHAIMITQTTIIDKRKGDHIMRKKPNDDLREYAKRRGVYLWEIAEIMKITPSTLSVKFRHALSADEKKKMRGIIDGIAKDRG